MSTPVSSASQLVDLIGQLKNRLNALSARGDCAELADEARQILTALEGEVLEPDPVPDPEPVPPPGPIADGRYEGGNQALFVDLRLDFDGSGVVSADLFRLGATGRSYVASIRTVPGERVERGAGAWIVIGEDELGQFSEGRLAIAAVEQALTCSLTLDSQLQGLPVGNPILFTAERISPRLRALGIELETEVGVAPIADFDFGGRAVSVESSFRDAGLDLQEAGSASAIPAPANPWGTAQLHALMADFAQASLSRRAWELHLLVLSRSSRSGLLGVMFDSNDMLPRQGTAVFATEIRNIPGIVHERKLIQTTVHELGHALNLAHRFERPVGRADSTSFMNYDWRYLGGNRRNEYWERFAFTFDADELEFIRHAPAPALIPGGAAFHSVNYWADGNGGYSPYVPEVPFEGFQLTLAPPTGGPVFNFGQPAFLRVTLTNLTGQPLEISPSILDTKGGLLEVLIRRRGSVGGGPLEDAVSFVPIVERCYDFDPRIVDTVPDGQSISNNLNLTFGSGGFSFAEPGEYDVTALLVVFDQPQERDLIVTSNTLRIRVATPKTIVEENDALVLLREDVGVYFALGGARTMSAASDDLEALRERRQGSKKTITDPVVANIVRCQGIDAGRPYMHYSDDRYRESDGDPGTAARLLRELGSKAMLAFDEHTRDHTRKLAEKHRKRAQKAGRKAK